MARGHTRSIERARKRRIEVLEQTLADKKCCPPASTAELQRLIEEAVNNGKVTRIEGGRKKKPDMRRRHRGY